MASRLEDYALIGDCQTAALVAKDGAVDWLCMPRFDSDACFAALLGDERNGRWVLAPTGPARTRRRYLDDTLVLETTHETAEGEVSVIDFMPMRDEAPDVVRIVVGKRGSVAMRLEFTLRFGYGLAVPWVTQVDGGIQAVAGPDLVQLIAPVQLSGENMRHTAEFTVRDGERIPFVMTWSPSHKPRPERVDAEAALDETTRWWARWIAPCKVEGPHAALVRRSLVTLKALTYEPTGGVVAAPTTSLPELPGGQRNWDYRYCWLRDATLTLHSMMAAGFVEEAQQWRKWLLRAVAGDPSQLQIMYGLAGERRLPESELGWLAGYEGSKPVRIGNAASDQLQLDVYGEVMDAIHLSREMGLSEADATWSLERKLVEFLEGRWKEPDEGIWEVRGPRRHFVHSKVMAWVALDRAVEAIEEHGCEGPLERWRAVRDEIHASVCEHGFDRGLDSFVQSYGAREVDASLLMIPLVGFLPATDPRMLGTVRAIESQLLRDGFVARYRTKASVDGLPEGEGAFLACSFWLADNYLLQGRRDEARALFDRLASLANDVGLLSEEYDPRARRLVGNFPQAFSHVSLVNTALGLSRERAALRRGR